MTAAKGRRTAASAFAALVLLASTMASARAQEVNDPPRPTAELHLTGISGVIGPGLVEEGEGGAGEVGLTLRVLVENDGELPLDGVQLVVDVYERAQRRSSVHIALDDGDPGRRFDLVDSESLPIREGSRIEPGDVAGITVTRPAEAMPWNSGGIPTDGLYPVRISLLQGAERLDSITTAVTHLAEAVSAPLQAVVVWPLDGPTWRRPDGSYDEDVDAPIRPGGRLDRFLAAIERVPDAAVLLAPDAALLEDLADRADGFSERFLSDDGFATREILPEDPPAQRAARFLERLSTALANVPLAPLAPPYARADVAGLVAAPDQLDDEAVRAITNARSLIADVTGVAPDLATYWATTPLSREALDVAIESGANRLLLPFEMLQHDDDLSAYPELPPPVRSLTTAKGRRVLAGVSDPYLDEAIERAATQPALEATQRLLAETAIVWAERPNDAQRLLVVAPPPGWAPLDPRLTESLLQSLRTAPWLELTGFPNPAVATPRPRGAMLAPRPEGLPDGLADAIVQARSELTAIQEALLDPGGDIGGRPFEELDRNLLRAPSWWLRDQPVAGALVDSVQAAVDEAFGTVEVATGATITLTSETGTIPVTLRRDRGGPLRVRVEMVSTSSLQWVDGRERTVELQRTGAQTLSFAVRALTTGSYQVGVRVTEPGAGARVLAEGTIPVRSTAISTPALAGTVAVVLVLLLLGAARRRPRPALEVVKSGERS